MDIVHIAAIPQEKEQRCVRCCRKILDIDPVTEATFPILAFVAQRASGQLHAHDSGEYTMIQATDATEGQLACRKPGRLGKEDL